jgi:hypothetical protein
MDRDSPDLGEGQLLHFTSLALLLALASVLWTAVGRPAPVAFWTAMAFPVGHQVFVWLAWRLALRPSAIDQAIDFKAYLAVFFLLFGGRFISLLALAWLDRGSLGLPAAVTVVAVTPLALLGLYTMYSVKRYFGLIRAAGVDHFDARYRNMPLVAEGMFRFTSNGMYVFGFCLFWAIAIGFDSTAALIVAAFSHAYIWVHFHATEKPDMGFLYGPTEEGPG